VSATGALAVWMLVFELMGLCGRYWNNPPERVRYLSDSAYWLYLAHPLALVPVEFALWHAPVGWGAKRTFILGAAVPVLLASYHWLVRPAWLGELRRHAAAEGVGGLPVPNAGPPVCLRAESVQGLNGVAASGQRDR